MRSRIVRIGVMDIVGADQFDAGLLAHAHQLLIDQFLCLDPVALQFQKIIIFSKDGTVLKGDLLCLLIHATLQITGYHTRQAGTQGDDALVVLFQCLHIHTRFVVVAIHKTNGNDLDQILIADIIFCQEYQMIIAVIPM